ncbi:MAG: hypothetical protein ACTHL6_12625, partial [Arthrobacter sp.]
NHLGDRLPILLAGRPLVDSGGEDHGRSGLRRRVAPISRIRFKMFISSPPLPWWFLLWRTVLPGEAGTVAHGPGRLAAAFAQ